MTRIIPLLLDVWREVCRHLEIGESVERIAPLLGRQAPVDLILVRQIDVQRSWVDTLAAGRAQPGEDTRPARTVCSAQELQVLLDWCREGEVAHGPAEALRARLPGLVPAEISGDVLAGPLAVSDAPVGFLVLSALPGRAFRGESADLVRALLEPFAVALENDRRLRELTA